MLVSEFIDRTGYHPTAEEYKKIENEYNHSSFLKDEFCRLWRKANPEKAGQIQRQEKAQKRREKVAKIVLKEIQAYKGTDPYEDTTLLNCYDIMDRKKITAQELWTAAGNVENIGQNIGLNYTQVVRARLLKLFVGNMIINK